MSVTPAASQTRVLAGTGIIGEDGFALLDRLDEPTTPKGLHRLPGVEVRRQVGARHFVHKGGASGWRRAAQDQRRRAAPDGADRVALRPGGTLSHPLGHLLDWLHRPP